MEGKAARVIRPELLDRWHVVGKGADPVLICKKSELAGLFSPLFYQVFEVWNYFHAGFGLPGGLPWDELDPILCKLINCIEAHYQTNFSTAGAQLQYTEAQMRQGRQ